jgi:hypothetical protein
MKALPAALDYGISAETHTAVGRGYEKWADSEQLESQLAFLDSVTNTFKVQASTISLPAHIRNAATGAIDFDREGLRVVAASLHVYLMRDWATWSAHTSGCWPAFDSLRRWSVLRSLNSVSSPSAATCERL